MVPQMNARDAFHATVHNSPGGCEALAIRMDVAAGVLRNKANPNSTYHKPTLDDVERVMVLTGDTSVLHALAASVSHVCIRTDTDIAISDVAVLELVAKAWSTCSEVGTEVYATLADGIVEQAEVKRVSARVYSAVKALNELVLRLDGMAEK